MIVPSRFYRIFPCVFAIVRVAKIISSSVFKENNIIESQFNVMAWLDMILFQNVLSTSVTHTAIALCAPFLVLTTF